MPDNRSTRTVNIALNNEKNRNNILKIIRWSEDEFYKNRDEWQNLLARSDVDKLFMSWAWMHGWWKLWGYTFAAELSILAVYSQNTLVGLAPLYVAKVRAGSWLKVKRLQFLGTSFRNSEAVRAEYLQFIADRGIITEVVERLFEYIFKISSWDELVLIDLVTGSETDKILKQYEKANYCYARRDAVCHTYSVDCRRRFSDYISGLGKNTRLRLYGRRKKLQQHGEIALKPVRVEDITALIAWLDIFHKKRWGYPFFCAKRKTFVTELMKESELHGPTHSSLLIVAGEPVSIILNFRTEDRIYNIQLGFDESFDRKLSLGLLHLGYTIESVCDEPGISQFDMLAGVGRNMQINYKSYIGTQDTVLETRQVIRKFRVKLLYFLYDRVISRLRSRR